MAPEPSCWPEAASDAVVGICRAKCRRWGDLLLAGKIAQGTLSMLPAMLASQNEWR